MWHLSQSYMWYPILPLSYFNGLWAHFFDATTKNSSHPIHYAWDSTKSNPMGHCINIKNFFIGTGSCNVGLNLLIFLLVRHNTLLTLLRSLDEQ